MASYIQRQKFLATLLGGGVAACGAQAAACDADDRVPQDAGARHAIPAIHSLREFAVAGGLMSYGTNVLDAYYQNGVYVGRPSDLSLSFAPYRTGAEMVRVITEVT